MAAPSVLYVITGGIAAIRCFEILKGLRERGAEIRIILTRAAKEFVTELSVSAYAGVKIHQDLFDPDAEIDFGHIELTRNADMILVAPATANFIAKLARGFADDLASAALTANNRKPVFLAPAMNPQMWENFAVRENTERLIKAGFNIISPAEGRAACGEIGAGRMAEPADILEFMFTSVEAQNHYGKALTGKTILVTAGPTEEAWDPVRYVSNRSSGKQGYAVAEALAQAGARVLLVSGPCLETPPQGVELISVRGAEEMVCVAAVCDWRPDYSPAKLKKTADQQELTVTFRRNPDILAEICASERRPAIVYGFCAETENPLENGLKKLKAKQCDAIYANLVGSAENPVFGADHNKVFSIRKGIDAGKRLVYEGSKKEIARRIAADLIADLS
jgi:phosphopantothenoylcysteine decarboxylase / phosphopantothenate---cysteine ligase